MSDDPSTSGIGGLLNLKTAGQHSAYLYDGKGNVETVLDNSESVVAVYRYDPFGVLLNRTGSVNQPYGFSTKRSDLNIGLVFYEYRLYGPNIGKWFTRDPLGEQGGLNQYAFVGNNPVNWVDPWGLAIRSPGAENAAQALAEMHGRLRGYVDFLPDWLLDLLLPIDPQLILNDGLSGLLCPLVTPITQNSVIEGFRVSNHAWRKSGLGRGATEELISNVIQGARNAGTVVTEIGTGKFAGNIIEVYQHNGIKVAVDVTRKLIMSIRPLKGFKLP